MDFTDLKNFTNSKGFVAIITVLTLLVFSLSLTLATTYLSIGEAKSALALSQGEAALALTEGCAEDALILSGRDENYTGGSYSYLGGACAVDISKDLLEWTIDVVGTRDGFERHLEIVVLRVPGLLGLPATLTLQSWLEK